MVCQSRESAKTICQSTENQLKLCQPSEYWTTVPPAGQYMQLRRSCGRHHHGRVEGVADIGTGGQAEEEIPTHNDDYHDNPHYTHEEPRLHQCTALHCPHDAHTLHLLTHIVK